MNKKVAAWLGGIKLVLFPPYVLWSHPLADGVVEIRVSQPFYLWLLVILVVIYTFFPVRLLAIPWLALLGLIVTGFVWARQLAISIQATRKLRYAAFTTVSENESLGCVCKGARAAKSVHKWPEPL